jgi:hypothetical protein
MNEQCEISFSFPCYFVLLPISNVIMLCTMHAEVHLPKDNYTSNHRNISSTILNTNYTNLQLHFFFFFKKKKALTVLHGPLAYPNGLSRSTYRDILVGLLGWGISPTQGLY